MTKTIPAIQNANVQPQSSPCVADLAEQIQRRLAARVGNDRSVQCVLMVEPTLRDAADEASYAASLGRWAHACSVPAPEDLATPIKWSHPNLKPEHRPQLISLALDRYASADLLHASLAMALEDQHLESRRRGEGNRINGWLLTSCSVKRLAKHLGAIAVQRLPADFHGESNKRTLLRYFDPNVMPALWKLSTDVQRNSLLGPIDEWILLDQSGQLQSYGHHATCSEDPPLGPTGGHIGYSTSQWLTLNSVGALNQVIIRLQLRELDGIPCPANAADVALQALVRARAAGVSDQRDLQEFSWHALTVDAYFDAHPTIIRRLRSLKDGSHGFYTAAIADLSADDWGRIRADISREERIS